jgi:hypothetical protein
MMHRRDTNWLSVDGNDILRSFHSCEHKRNSSRPRKLAWGQEETEKKSNQSREAAFVVLVFVPTDGDEFKMMHWN